MRDAGSRGEVPQYYAVRQLGPRTSSKWFWSNTPRRAVPTRSGATSANQLVHRQRYAAEVPRLKSETERGRRGKSCVT